MVRESTWGDKRVRIVGLIWGCLAVWPGAVAHGDAFDDYELTRTVTLPTGAGAFDVLSDGRLWTLSGPNVFVETGIGSGAFLPGGELMGGDFSSSGAAFVRVSPNGMHVAVGNGGGASFGNYQVGVFETATLAGAWFGASHFDAEWADDTQLALTAGTFGQPSVVTILDTTSDPAAPANTTIVEGIGGASSGIAFDAGHNLYTGNGFAGAGPSGTGAIKHFTLAAWSEALSGGGAIDFEANGTLIVEILSAGSLGFDHEGHLHVGGGDFLEGEMDFGALVRSGAIEDAIAGLGPVDPLDPEAVRRLDPDGGNPANFYDLNHNAVTGELYVREGSTIYVYAVPEPGTGILLAVLGGIAFARRRRRGVEPSRATRRSVHRAALGVGLIIPAALPAMAHADTPFATDVLEFAPAPGQFVNNPDFNDATRALGAPTGGGTNAPDNSSLVSLGGFGGVLVLAMDHTVTDDAANPFGIDAIVYGNASFVAGNPNRRWAEAAVIEISVDANQNGLADDPWYLILGSHITDPDGQWHIQTWDDDTDDPTYPPANPAWIPPGQSGSWTSETYRLPELFETLVLENPNGGSATQEGVFGYADCTPSLLLGDTDGDNVVDAPAMNPEVFYTYPDDPFVVGLSPGCGGGDGFDIAWAIDPATGEPADLAGFDFVRITNGVHFVSGLGEHSPEIDAVADVAAGIMGDADYDGDIDLADFERFVACLAGPSGGALPPRCRVVDFDSDADVDLQDAAVMVRILEEHP